MGHSSMKYQGLLIPGSLELLLLGQGPAAHSSGEKKLGPLPVSINKIGFKHSKAHAIMECLCYLPPYNGKGEAICSQSRK